MKMYVTFGQVHVHSINFDMEDMKYFPRGLIEIN